MLLCCTLGNIAEKHRSSPVWVELLADTLVLVAFGLIVIDLISAAG
jgi:hypothetical protein